MPEKIRDFKCPYFVSNKSDKPISCELALIRPPDKQTRAEILDNLCGGGDKYLQCPFYQVLDNHYKRKYGIQLGGSRHEMHIISEKETKYVSRRQKSLASSYRALQRAQKIYGHEDALAQLKKEAEEADAELNRENTEDNGTVHETGSNDVEE